MRFDVFSPCEALRGAKNRRALWIIGAARAASAGLTILQRAGAFCADPEQPPSYLHDFKTTARNAFHG
jgi:hypothetical protein